MNILYKNETEGSLDPFSVYAAQVHTILFYFLKNLSEEMPLRSTLPTYLLIEDYGEDTDIHDGEAYNRMTTTSPELLDLELLKDVPEWRNFVSSKMEDLEGIGFCVWLYIYNNFEEEYIFTIIYKKDYMIQGYLIPLPLSLESNIETIDIQEVLPNFEMSFEDDILIK